MGNKQGAVDTITSLEQDGLGIVISTKTQGTAKVGCDKSILNLPHKHQSLRTYIFSHFPLNWCFMHYRRNYYNTVALIPFIVLCSQQYTFVKTDIEKGGEAELADKLAKYAVTLRQYRQSLMEEEILPSRTRQTFFVIVSFSDVRIFLSTLTFIIISNQ